MRAYEFLQATYQKWSCPDASERRVSINSKMFHLNSSGIDCKNCSGMCCTYENNSMQVDPLQALELLSYLESKDLLDKYLDSIKQSVQNYRLDKEIYLGNGKQLRRYYTCPFYMKQSCGCPIGTGFKPYGCLAFNPLKENVSVEGHCTSDIEILEFREKKFGDLEEKVNQSIKEELKLYWDKKPMPIALLEILEKLSA